MKRLIYATIAIFVAILIVTFVLAERIPVHTVSYEDGGTVQQDAK